MKPKTLEYKQGNSPSRPSTTSSQAKPEDALKTSFPILTAPSTAALVDFEGKQRTSLGGSKSTLVKIYKYAPGIDKDS